MPFYIDVSISNALFWWGQKTIIKRFLDESGANPVKKGTYLMITLAIFLTGYFFVVSGNICTLLSSEDGEVTDSQPMSDLYCEQEEADTKILFHCQYISRHNSSLPIIVRSVLILKCLFCF